LANPKSKRKTGYRIERQIYETRGGWRGLVKFLPNGGTFLTGVCGDREQAESRVQAYLDGLAQDSAEE
jgi:hypothetical protein